MSVERNNDGIDFKAQVRRAWHEETAAPTELRVRVQAILQESSADESTETHDDSPLMRIRPLPMWRYAVTAIAASVLLFLGLSAYTMLQPEAGSGDSWAINRNAGSGA